jgi:hypothetical protein
MRSTITRGIALPLAGLAVLAAGVAGAGEPRFDHLKCFKIKDELVPRRKVISASLVPEQRPFGDQRCEIELPASHLCVDVAKENVRQRGGEPYPVLSVGGGEARDYLCYRLRCEKEPVAIEATDQFHGRVIRTKRADLFCAPASKILP